MSGRVTVELFGRGRVRLELADGQVRWFLRDMPFIIEQPQGTFVCDRLLDTGQPLQILADDDEMLLRLIRQEWRRSQHDAEPSTEIGNLSPPANDL